MKLNVYKDKQINRLGEKVNLKENFKEQKRRQLLLIKLLNKLNKLNQNRINQQQVNHLTNHLCLNQRPKI